jgi:hypothetical protein
MRLDESGDGFLQQGTKKPRAMPGLFELLL